MDALSVLANLVGLISAAAPLDRRGIIERELHGCFATALRQGFVAQDKDDRGASASLIADGLSPQELFRILVADGAPLTDAARERAWQAALIEQLSRLGLRADAIDIARLADDTARSLTAAIKNAAMQPGSALFRPLLVAHVTSANNDRTAAVAAWNADVSNLAELPLAPAPQHRVEVEEVESALQEHPVVVISGGAGLGKSTLALMVARRQADADRPPLIWWMNASSRENLAASCDALLRALGVEPDDDVLKQVRRELSRQHRWFLVLDDVVDGDLIGAVIPGGAKAGSAIATTRDSTLRSPGRMLTLGPTDEIAMRNIARSLLPSSTPVDQLHDIVHSCAGHPLVLATACRYVTATGTSAAELSELLRSEPSLVLSEALGPHYPISFADLVARMLGDVRDAASMQVLLTAVVASDQQVPRALLDAAISLAPADIRAGMRRCGAFGLIELSDSAVRCHAMVAELVIASSPKAAAAMATRVLESIESRISEYDGSRLREVAAIANTVSVRVQDSVATMTSVHLALADALGGLGFTGSAIEQIDILSSRIPEDVPVDVRGKLLVTEARANLRAGDYPKSINAAEQGIALGERIDDDSIRAACLVVLAWCYENQGDRAAAQRSAQAAAALVPHDRDLQSLKHRFSIPDAPMPEYIDRFLELAEDPDVGSPMRALYFGLASRAANKLRQSDEAIAYARRALELDRSQGVDRTTDIARDLNDLGMALLDAGMLDEAEVALLDSVEIYESEDTRNPLGAIPRTHLGRLLAGKMYRAEEPPTQAEYDRAIGIVEPAVRALRVSAPFSPDHAAALSALADVVVFQDQARAAELLDEALKIDRAIYPVDHYEVGVDVLKLMGVEVLRKRFAEALHAFRIVQSALPAWGNDHPDIAVQLLCVQADALAGLGVVAALPRVAQSLSRLIADERISESTRAYAEDKARGIRG